MIWTIRYERRGQEAFEGVDGETLEQRERREDYEAERMVRANGDVLCSCGQPYRKHPWTTHRTQLGATTNDGIPYMHKLCDGRIVKL